MCVRVCVSVCVYVWVSGKNNYQWLDFAISLLFSKGSQPPAGPAAVGKCPDFGSLLCRVRVGKQVKIFAKGIKTIGNLQKIDPNLGTASLSKHIFDL